MYLHLYITFIFQVFWLKDGDEIDVRRTNYIVSSEGDLMIGQVKLGDMGNYTCGARNILTKRLSDFATLTVFGRFLIFEEQ